MPAPEEISAMRTAIALARSAGRTSPNPRVGCVLLDASGRTVATGYHRGAGLPHAEVEALRAAGQRSHGTTAVVTLEPCTHTGRTGPCSRALIEAGVRRVVIARPDPNAVASGGAEALRAAGLDVVSGVLAEEADINRAWETAVRRQRPFVTWKTATSLDGRIAAADGTSRWITGPQARVAVHRLRAEADAILVGTGTVLADNPSLTARTADGAALPVASQPLRVVLGRRRIPAGAAVLDDAAPTLQLADPDPGRVLAALWQRDARHVLLEGGATVTASWLTAGVVDEIHWYVAPIALGRTGVPSLALDVATLAAAPRWHTADVERFGDDTRITLTVGRAAASAEGAP